MDAVNIVNKKRDGNIKWRTCANGITQRQYLSEKKSIASQTVLLEELFTTMVIDTHVEIYVAIFDVPGAYLHSKMLEGKTILLKLQGYLVDIMFHINP